MNKTLNQTERIANTSKWLVKHGYKKHHAASRRGYCAVAEVGSKQPYCGRYGEGYIVRLGRAQDSTWYESIEYWVK